MPTNELDFRKNQLAKWKFKEDEWKNNGVISGNDIDVAIRKFGKNELSGDNESFFNSTSNYCIWLETKDGNYCTIWEMLAQIIFTAHKVLRKATEAMPPYLGCFDNEKGAIIEFYNAEVVFGLTDINLSQSASQLDDYTIRRIQKIIQDKVFVYQDLDEFGNKLKQIQQEEKVLSDHITKKNFCDVFIEESGEKLLLL